MKVQGKRNDFAPLRYEGSQVIISYGLKEEAANLYEWNEILIPKKNVNQITLNLLKKEIIADINKDVDKKILNGMKYTIAGTDREISVWLSAENQRNIQEASRLNIIPFTLKLSEESVTKPIYHTFKNLEELHDFCRKVANHIQGCLKKGWQEKDNIDWNIYKQCLK